MVVERWPMPISTPLQMLESACPWPKGSSVENKSALKFLIHIQVSLRHMWVTICYVSVACCGHGLQTSSDLKLVSWLERTMLGQAAQHGSCQSQDMISLGVTVVH